MDPLDQKLCDLLRANARLPIAELARLLGVTRATVQARLTRLETSGQIIGYTVREPLRDTGVRAHVSLRIAPQAQDRVETRLSAMPEVQQLFSVSGVSDALAIVTAHTPAQLDIALDKIRGLDGILATESAILLRQKWQR